MAATIVVVRHVFNTVNVPLDTRFAVLRSPLALVLNGQGAVQMFFVLSGFVLSASLARGRGGGDLLQFYVKRIFRIHVPYVFALWFAWAASFVYPAPGSAGISLLFQHFADVHLGWHQLLRFMLFPGDAARQLPVGWTLGVEMLFSFLLPLMVFIAARIHWTVLILASAALLGTAGIVEGYLRYAIDFALGIAIFQCRETLTTIPWSRFGITVAPASLTLVTYPVFAGSLNVFEGVVISGFQSWEIVTMGVGASGLLIVALRDGLPRRLHSTRPCVLVGRISYSLYLVHFTVLLAFARALTAPVGAGQAVIFLASVLIASMAIATISHRYVELPAIRIGNVLCREIARLLSVSSRLSGLVVSGPEHGPPPGLGPPTSRGS